MAIKHKYGEILKCPHCRVELFYPVNEYHLPSGDDKKNTFDCGGCDKKFVVRKTWDIGMKRVWEYTVFKHEEL